MTDDASRAGDEPTGEESIDDAIDDDAIGDDVTGLERIRSIAVHREDVATALEATLRSDKRVVLRITPPFSGRMRARLHTLGAEPIDGSDAGHGSDETDDPILVDPRDLVPEVPPYPEVDETAAKYPDADVESRRERHAEAVAAWRERVRGSVVSSVAIGSGDEGEGGDEKEDGDDIDGSPTVDVTVLG